MRRMLKPATMLTVFTVFIVIMGFFVFFIRPDPITQPSHRLTTNDIQTGDVTALSGYVAFNSHLACLENESDETCDETYPQFINLQTADELVTIIYNTSEGCDNLGAISQGQQSRPGTPVEAFTQLTEQGMLSTCTSTQHYIQPISR